jgi:hypothetical protein
MRERLAQASERARQPGLDRAAGAAERRGSLPLGHLEEVVAGDRLAVDLEPPGDRPQQLLAAQS